MASSTPPFLNDKAFREFESSKAHWIHTDLQLSGGPGTNNCGVEGILRIPKSYTWSKKGKLMFWPPPGMTFHLHQSQGFDLYGEAGEPNIGTVSSGGVYNGDWPCAFVDRNGDGPSLSDQAIFLSGGNFINPESPVVTRSIRVLLWNNGLSPFGPDNPEVCWFKSSPVNQKS